MTDVAEVDDRARAETYMRFALVLIAACDDIQDLRDWWTDEKDHRDLYGLTEDERQRLVSACRSRAEILRTAIKPSKGRVTLI